MNDLLNCDAISGLEDLPPAPISLTVTSPPWDHARDYGGHEFDFEPGADELWRVTKPGGIVCWHYQDQVDEYGSESLTSEDQRRYFRDLGFLVHQTITILYVVIPTSRTTLLSVDLTGERPVERPTSNRETPKRSSKS